MLYDIPVTKPAVSKLWNKSTPTETLAVKQARPRQHREVDQTDTTLRTVMKEQQLHSVRAGNHNNALWYDWTRDLNNTRPTSAHYIR